jgi:hypothetical protein
VELRSALIDRKTILTRLNLVDERCRATAEVAAPGSTGIECEVTGIVGIYSDPRHVILYTSNGEVRQEFSIVLTARPLGGQPTPSSESSEVRWVTVSDVPLYTMDRSMRLRISDYLTPREAPVIA